MNFPYMHQESFLGDLEVEDVGNCCINGINDDAQEWYICIDTELGWTTVKQFGPLTADIDGIQGSFSYSQFKLEYGERQIHKIINEFLNNRARLITQATIIERSEMEDRFNKLNISI